MYQECRHSANRPNSLRSVEKSVGLVDARLLLKERSGARVIPKTAGTLLLKSSLGPAQLGSRAILHNMTELLTNALNRDARGALRSEWRT